MSDERSQGERWAEIAIASFLKAEAVELPPEAASVVVDLARRVEDRTWRRPELLSSADLEARL